MQIDGRIIEMENRISSLFHPNGYCMKIYAPGVQTEAAIKAVAFSKPRSI